MVGKLITGKVKLDKAVAEGYIARPLTNPHVETSEGHIAYDTGYAKFNEEQPYLTILKVDPADHEIDVPLDKKIIIVFSQQLDPGSFTEATITLLEAGENPVQCTKEYYGNDTIILTPNSPLGVEINHTLSVYGYLSNRGTSMEDTFTSDFTTILPE